MDGIARSKRSHASPSSDTQHRRMLGVGAKAVEWLYDGKNDWTLGQLREAGTLWIPYVFAACKHGV